MKLIIAGGRTLYVSTNFIDTLLVHFGLSPTEIISGTTIGIDRCGEGWSEDRLGKKATPFFPNWNTYGKAAGPIRNKKMAEYLEPKKDGVLLIWDGKSRGTTNMKQVATLRKLNVYECILKKNWREE